MRDENARLWNACKETARRKNVVLVHCNNSFHRGPLAVAAIMGLAGYNHDSAFSSIAHGRRIYPGHIVPFCDWPESERAGRHAQDFLECHTWILTLADVAANTAVVAMADVKASSASDAQNSSGAAFAPLAVMQASHTYWRCSSCNKLDQNMRQCWECWRWDCESCSFWRTTCPKGKYQYNICGHCNAEGIYLTRQGKIWRCSWCSHGHR